MTPLPIRDVARPPGTSTQAILHRDGRPVPAGYELDSYRFLGDGDIAFSRYTDPAFMASEIDRMWSRTWQWACREEHIPTEHERKLLGSMAKNIDSMKMFKGKGCPVCNGTGYKGRKGIFEIFTVDDTVQRMIFDRVPTTTLRTRVREMGMRTLREDGMLKVASGMTTLEEVLRATMGDEN